MAQVFQILRRRPSGKLPGLSVRPSGLFDEPRAGAARRHDHLDGLDWLLPQLDGQPAGPKPKPQGGREPAAPAAPK